MKKQTQEELFLTSPGACGAIKTHTGHSAAYKLLWISAGPDAVTREPQRPRCGSSQSLPAAARQP